MCLVLFLVLYILKTSYEVTVKKTVRFEMAQTKVSHTVTKPKITQLECAELGNNPAPESLS